MPSGVHLPALASAEVFITQTRLHIRSRFLAANYEFHHSACWLLDYVATHIPRDSSQGMDRNLDPDDPRNHLSRYYSPAAPLRPFIVEHLLLLASLVCAITGSAVGCVGRCFSQAESQQAGLKMGSVQGSCISQSLQLL